MKPAFAIIGGLVIVALVVFGFYMIDVDQTQEAQLPDVDVSVEGGQAPEFDVDTGSVAVGEEEVTVTVPTLEVTPPEDDNAADNN